jgi:hypothetical protein
MNTTPALSRARRHLPAVLSFGSVMPRPPRAHRHLQVLDHHPLYRQAEIYARSGIDVDRGQLAEWLGHVAWLLKPLGALIAPT